MIRQGQNGKPVILVAEPISRRAMDYLSEQAHVRTCALDDVLGHVAEADGLVIRTYTRVDEALLEKARRLKVIDRAGVGLRTSTSQPAGGAGSLWFTRLARTQPPSPTTPSA